MSLSFLYYNFVRVSFSFAYYRIITFFTKSVVLNESRNIIYTNNGRLMVERLPRDWEVMGSIPDHIDVMQMVPGASLHCLAYSIYM